MGRAHKSLASGTSIVLSRKVSWNQVTCANKRTMAALGPRKLLNSKILGLPGVDAGKSRWGTEAAYFVDGKEFVHFHDPREIDIRLTRRLQKLGRRKLRQDSRIGFRKGNSEWITFSLTARRDVRLHFS